MSKIIKYLIVSFTTFSFFFFLGTEVFAQELDISVSPPITEIIMVPGKEIVQTYKIINKSDSKLISVNIVPFLPNINKPEEIVINEKEGLVNSDTYRSWFEMKKPKVNFGQTFTLSGNSEEEISISISVPQNAITKDYYFTVLFSVQKMNSSTSETSLESLAQIGSNILITASEKENPYKSSNTILFSSPFIIDSLQKINYKIIIENIGKAFAKPNGKITIENVITNNTEILSLSPLNILPSYSREIYCLKGEEIIPCQSSSKIYLGLYKSTLSYSLDGEEIKHYEDIYTFAFPFSLIITLIIILIIYKIINTKSKK